MTAAVALAGTVSWGSAIEVPGTAALNVGDHADVLSVSCASAGNCSAGGYYADGSNFGTQAFVVSEQGGVWGTAIEVPGTAQFGRNAEVAAVSCAAPGDCAAGGGPAEADYGSLSPAFVVDEANGSWGTATAVRGLAHLNAGDGATVTSVSCGSPGNCAAAGYYAAGSDRYGDPWDFRAFVVSEKNGNWGTARRVATAPGFSVRGHTRVAYSVPVSCVGVGHCVAGGSAPNRQAFIVVARNGAWDPATKVPGMVALTGRSGQSGVKTVSCTSPGDCAAGGWYTRGTQPGREYAFVVAERNGKWGNAIRLRGIPAAPSEYGAGVWSLSCASAGNCAGGGLYANSTYTSQAFVVAEHNGVWGAAEEVPGTATLNTGGNAWVASVSCASAGNCAASGYYLTYVAGHYTNHAFVVSERAGVWGTAEDVPGMAALAVGGVPGYPWSSPVSCASSGSCAIGGSYIDGSDDSQAYVTAP